ncbi:MAG: methionine--tRNA ligase [Candidatus Nealsonbacteria bacterium]|nr:methionine--tRNA ligase [Candidatus Nealsonbacteria bacterium]
MTNKFYITTTLPYVNSEPHIGFALEIVQADALARYQRLQGKNVFFNFGVDEHGLKIYRKAVEAGKEPQSYCDEYAVKFEALKKALNLSYNNFVRTTDEHHIKAAQEFWRECDRKGDIYKKNYKTKYCVGCELEKTDSELTDGRCLIHPNRELEIIEEENYFFRFSKYQKPLLDFYDKTPDFVIPESKFNEIKTFVKNGLQDFSVSRLKNKMPWGIDVPNDPEQVMFVWFDALVNYVSAVGWPDDMKKFKTWWPVVQFAGKDNLRQQTATWQAMLMSAGLANSKQIFIHGFITIDGQKISKSLGNVINPIELVEKYGTDPVRYYLLAKVSPFEDGDFSESKLKEVYNTDLAGGLGNLVARVITLSSKFKIQSSKLANPELAMAVEEMKQKVGKAMQEFKFNEALLAIWQLIAFCDRYIDKTKPWEEKEQSKQVIGDLLLVIGAVADSLVPFLPETSAKIQQQLLTNKKENLFPRLN